MERALQSQDIDMLVVGNGATSMTMALALATHGLRVHIVSRSCWLDPCPDTQLLDRRSMAIFRELGVEDDLIGAATCWPQLGGTVYADRLGGTEITRIAGAPDQSAGAPIDIAQSALVNTLLCKAAACGATVAFNGEYLGHQQDEHGVTVTLHDAVLDRIYTLRTRYLFGADGYRSRGGEEGCARVAQPSAPLGTIEARFTADLAAQLGDHPNVFNWITEPDVTAGRTGAGLLRAVSPWSEWIARWNVDMSAGETEPDCEAVRRCIAAMVGSDGSSVTLGEIRLRPVSHKLARARGKGRVFCGGDVIRYLTHPGGPGTNSGIHDAYDLACKLALTARGEAGTGLLDSYSGERAPVEPRLTLVAGGKGVGDTPLEHFVTGPAGSKEIAAALCAKRSDLLALDQRRITIARPPVPRAGSAHQVVRSRIAPRAGHHAGH